MVLLTAKQIRRKRNLMKDFYETLEMLFNDRQHLICEEQD